MKQWYPLYVFLYSYGPGALLTKWIDCNPSMDKLSNQIPSKVLYNYILIPKIPVLYL